MLHKHYEMLFTKKNARSTIKTKRTRRKSTSQNLTSEQLEPRAMFSVSPIELIVSLDDASVSQIDYQCASAEVCVIEDVVSVQDVAQLTTGNVGAPIDGLTSILKDVAQEPSNPDAVSLNGLPSTNEDVTFNGEKITYMAGTPIEPMVSLEVANRDDMFGTLGATETWREESLLRYKIEKFDLLVGRFSTGNFNEKVDVVIYMMGLINDHMTSHHSGNDEFLRHVEEFMDEEILIYLDFVLNNMDRQH